MLERRLEQNGQLGYCRDNNIAAPAYSPLAQGLLTGKMTADRKFKESDVRRKSPWFRAENIKKVNRMLLEFEPMAEAHGATVGQLAIAWTLAQPGLSHVLCGARNRGQVEENARAGDIELSDEELQAIEKISKKYFDRQKFAINGVIITMLV